MPERDMPDPALAPPRDPASVDDRAARITDELVYRAIRQNETEALDSYIRRGLHLDADRRGKSLLLYAVKQGCTAAAVKLIDAGCNINAQDDQRYTPLMLAMPLGMNAVIEKLLEKGVDITLADKFNKNAADHARACDNSKGRYLLYKRLNAAELQGELFQAIAEENSELVRQLVEQSGVDFVSARNVKGQTALEAAELTCNFDLMEYFERKIADCGKDAADAVHNGTRESVKAMKRINLAPKQKY